MKQFVAGMTRKWAQDHLETIPHDDYGRPDMRGLSEGEAVVSCLSTHLVALGIALAADLERAMEYLTAGLAEGEVV